MKFDYAGSYEYGKALLPFKPYWIAENTKIISHISPSPISWPLMIDESWSNLTANRSFAKRSKTIQNEYKSEQDAGTQHNYKQIFNYLQNSGEI